MVAKRVDIPLLTGIAIALIYAGAVGWSFSLSIIRACGLPEEMQQTCGTWWKLPSKGSFDYEAVAMIQQNEVVSPEHLRVPPGLPAGWRRLLIPQKTIVGMFVNQEIAEGTNITANLLSEEPVIDINASDGWHVITLKPAYLVARLKPKDEITTVCVDDPSKMCAGATLAAAYCADSSIEDEEGCITWLKGGSAQECQACSEHLLAGLGSFRPAVAKNMEEIDGE